MLFERFVSVHHFNVDNIHSHSIHLGYLIIVIIIGYGSRFRFSAIVERFVHHFLYTQEFYELEN